MRVALTVEALEPEAALGAIRNLWQAFRKQYGRLPYFAWLELQRRGAVHYHALIVNPPWLFERDARHWLQQHWQLARVQPDVHRETADWFLSRAGAYVKAYAKKAGKKAYQQVYESIPRELRTFVCNRLEHQVAELDQHRDKLVVQLVGSINMPWYEQIENLWVVAIDRHVEEGRWCTLHGTCRIRAA